VRDVPAAFIADPFMVRHDNLWYLLCEVMNRETGRGEIGVATSTDGLAWEYQGTVLREPFHLSYPHLYRLGSTWYMIPETVWDGRVRLYRTDRFPFDWKPVATLLEGTFADPTMFHYEDRWWMFACTNPAQHDTLCLFHTADPFGGWEPHPANPIVSSDARIARPAGKIVTLNGRLLRFAQDCTPQYGSSVRAFEVAQLSTRAYAEHESQESPILKPGETWNSTGMHHIDAHKVDSPNGGQEKWVACVDGYRFS